MNNKLQLLFSLLLMTGVAQAQSQSVTISGHQLVASDSIWTVPAGATIRFEENASVEILGGLDFQGTQESPIVITSSTEVSEGLGFLINGQSSKNILMRNIHISGLQSPFRFDPYWYRGTVELDQITFLQNNLMAGNSALPLVSIGLPFLRLEAPAQLKLTSLYFANNKGGVLIDGLGQSGWDLFIDGMAFEYNTGFNTYHTPLHVELTGPSQNYSVNNLLFNQNDGFGWSLGGMDVVLKAGDVYTNALESSAILSKKNNYRLPALEANLSFIEKSDAPGFRSQILSSIHEPGTVVLNRAEGAQVTPSLLLDATGEPITFTQTATDRGLELSYEQGIPAYASFDNGVQFPITALAAEDMPEAIYDFRKPTFGGLSEMGLTDWWSGKAEQLLHPKNKPGFTQTWEMGGSFGGSLYDSRDLKLLRFSTSDISGLLPNIGLMWPVGAIGYTGGAFLQNNKSSYLSFRASVNAMNVNSGKILSFPYRFTSSPSQNRTINSRGSATNINHAFSTAIQTVEFEAIRHFRANNINEGKSSKWIPSWSAGVGALHFTPYATSFRRNTTEPYKWYLGNGRNVSANLRRAGTAGQNNIDGMSRYSSFALMMSTGFSMTYKKPTWSLSGAIKGNLTSTDYLDDFGRGTYYGGDYDGWLENLPEYTFNDPLTNETMTYSSSNIGRANRYGGSRAQNYMPDGYWEVKLSLSKNIDQNPLGKYDPMLAAHLEKLQNFWTKKRGAARLDSTWEWGAWFGTSIYDGRDLKYLQIANAIPVPTNIEFSEGLYLQKNPNMRYSWNIGVHAANLGYARRSGSPYIVTLPGAQIPSYNEALDTTVMINSSAANFFTRTSSIESNVFYHLRDYGLPKGKNMWLVPSFGLGLGVMNYTPYREVRGLDIGDPSFLSWKRSSTHYVDLREVGSEGQNILSNGSSYGKWAGLYNASFQLSLHTKQWVFKGEIKSTMTTTDYLDDFGRGAWYGGNYESWGDALQVSYFDVNQGIDVPLTPQQISNVPAETNLFTPRATNNLMDGYMQFHIGIAKRF